MSVMNMSMNSELSGLVGHVLQGVFLAPRQVLLEGSQEILH